MRFLLQGKVSEVMVRQGAVDVGFFTERANRAVHIENAFKAKTGLKRVTVNLILDHGNSRLQPIKEIMNAAGVQKLSDLQTLRVLQGVQTQTGEIDTLAMSADGTQIRFTPAADKGFELTLARQVGGQARAFAIRGVGGGPAAEVDITLSPELSLTAVAPATRS